MRSLVAWICSAVVLLAGPAWSCSPPLGDVPELTKAQKAHFADTILVGKILETYPDPTMNYGGDNIIYSAAMKVYCIYKGEVSDGVVNITHVGSIPGKCHTTNLVKGSEYVVYLAGQQHRINDVEIENTEQHRLDVSKACGLHLQYPEGISKEDLPHSCPEPASETECTPEYEAPPGPPGDHDHDSHGHDSHDIEGQDHEGHGHEGHGHEEYDHEGHDHAGHTHEEHDKHDQKDKEEHGHDDEHDHDGHDHDGHDHEGHGHDEYSHEDHDHVGHTHDEHDKHDKEHEHEHEEGHDHEHDHDHDDHDHDGHDHEGHDHDEYDHKSHDHEGHTHEEHDKHDKSHEDEHGHEVKASSSRGSCAIGVLLLSLGICLSL